MNATTAPVGAQLRAIVDELSTDLFERRQALEMCALAVLSNQHGFILGPPGTAKSDLTRRFFERITGARYFEQLLSKTRPEQAVLGPYDIPALREGNFRRRIDGYLLTADYAMLDEVGKMSPTLGHDLLAALNERVRHEVDGAHSVHPIPLRSAITASNEMIVAESEDAAAMWDRLLLRTTVDYIGEQSNFAALLASAVPGSSFPTTRTEVAFADLAHAADNVVPAVTIPVEVIDTVIQLRTTMHAAGQRVSDRRWRQSMRVVQAAAVLDGRTEASMDDLSALRFTLWDTVEERSGIERMVLKLSNPFVEQLLTITDSYADFRRGIEERKGVSVVTRAQYGSELLGKLSTIRRELTDLQRRAGEGGRSTTRVDDVIAEHEALKRSVYLNCLDIDSKD